LGVKFAVDDGRRGPEQRSKPLIAARGQLRQPWETRLQRTRELERASRPAAVIRRIVALQKRERRLVLAALMTRMELRKPAGRLQHRLRLADAAIPTDFAQGDAAVRVFEKQCRLPRFGIRGRAQTLRPGFEQWPDHAALVL